MDLYYLPETEQMLPALSFQAGIFSGEIRSPTVRKEAKELFTIRRLSPNILILSFCERPFDLILFVGYLQEVVHMTENQKQVITDLRGKGIGYAAIAKRLSISVNTVKAYCRRSGLSGNQDAVDTQPENVSVTSHHNGLLCMRNRGNSTVRRFDKGAQSSVELTVTYAEKSDGSAVADVLSMLISASCEVRK